MVQRKYITPASQLPIRLTRSERDLVVERAFLDPEMETLLRRADHVGSKLVVNLTLDDIDDLLGCVAAEANHCGDPKVRRVLDAVGDRLSALLDQFTDETPAPLVAVESPKTRFTEKQGSISRSFTTTPRSMACRRPRPTCNATSRCHPRWFIR